MSETHLSTTQRIGTFETADGSLVIYDVENHRGWVQSDGAVVLDSQA
ncbi:hypothetical protein VB773_01670 [Haloarculaceae archaeon H-GB2-1]|nr:hypothetical protein [Haloarculaceae archaeon H-GB1-1]MEA5388380.1 hypothetical protein [Haloarculaceae archaeon H-GB11]MEA5406416.1 hypothetical protein [Haloarculaceae archaeon H-GB2-1]